MRSLPAIAIALLLAAAAPRAQSVFIVDAQGGPGTVSLQTALASAVHGDLVYVRPASGSYGGGSTNQGITLIGQNRPRLSSLKVVGVPAGERFVMRGFELDTDSPFSTEALLLKDNGGAVILEDVHASSGPYTLSTFTLSTQVLIDNCSSVSLLRCAIRGGPAVDARSSVVALTSCTLDGFGWQAQRPFRAARALEATNANLIITDTTCVGGPGSSPAYPSPATSAPAARMVDTGTVFSGRGGSVFAAGPAPPGFSVPAAEISGGAVLDTGVSWLPLGAAPAIAGTTTVTTGEVPALTGNPAVLGQNLQASVAAPPGSTAWFLIGVPGPPLPVPSSPLALLWLSPTPLFVSAPAPVGGNGRAWIQVRIPNVGGLRDQPVTLQAVATGPSLPLSLSNPLFDVVR